MTDGDAPPADDASGGRHGCLPSTAAVLLKGLFGFLVFGAGLLAVAVSLLLLADGSALWSAGVGLVAVGGMVGGGRLVLGMRDGPERDGESAEGRKGSEPPGVLGTIRAWAGALLGLVGTLWSALWLSAFIGGAVFFGWKTWDLYQSYGLAWPTALSGGATLVLTAILGVQARSRWRSWREGHHDYGEEPGAYRREWASPRLRTTGFPLSVPGWNRGIERWGGMALSALVCWGAAAAMVVLFPPELWWGTLAVVVPGFLFSRAVYSGLRHRLRYGRAVVELEETPARLGASMRCAVETGLPSVELPEEGVHVVLGCYRRIPPGRRGKGPRYETLWYTERRVEPEGAGPATVSVAFDLPDDQPPSTLERLRRRVLWRLEVRAPGVDPPYEQHVVIPVFPAEEAPR